MRSTTASRSLLACSTRPSRRTRVSRAPASSPSALRNALSASLSRVSPTAKRSAAPWRFTSALAISSPSEFFCASISAGLAASSAIDTVICSRRASSSPIWPSASARRLLQPVWSWAIWLNRSARIAASRASRSQLPSASTSAPRSSAMRVRKAPAATRSAWVSEIADNRAWREVRRISASATSVAISAIACSAAVMRVRNWSVRRATSV